MYIGRHPYYVLGTQGMDMRPMAPLIKLLQEQEREELQNIRKYNRSIFKSPTL